MCSHQAKEQRKVGSGSCRSNPDPQHQLGPLTWINEDHLHSGAVAAALTSSQAAVQLGSLTWINKDHLHSGAVAAALTSSQAAVQALQAAGVIL